jgi:hypothetical protein
MIMGQDHEACISLNGWAKDLSQSDLRVVDSADVDFDHAKRSHPYIE